MAEEIAALFPEPSVEEILAEINKYGDYKNGVEWDYWKKGIALALSKLQIKGEEVDLSKVITFDKSALQETEKGIKEIYTPYIIHDRWTKDVESKINELIRAFNSAQKEER
jgi:hypothetical protein